MRNFTLFGLTALSILLLIGIVSASTAIVVNGGWVRGETPDGLVPPQTWLGSTYDFSSPVATHITYTDFDCIGDMAAFYEGGVLIGQGSSVTSEYPSCSHKHTADEALADGRFSHTCIDMAPGTHAVTAITTQMWVDRESDAWGWIRVDEGTCSGTSVPEFPSAALPATMIIGFLGAVLLIQRTREH